MRNVMNLLFLLGLTSAASASPTPRFPAAAVWNQDVSAASLKSAQSDVIIRSLVAQGGWGTGADRFQLDLSMMVLHAASVVPTLPVVGFDGYFSPDCDAPGSAFPIPVGGAIEGSPGYQCDNDGEDCHVLVVQGNTLFEGYRSNVAGGGLQAQCAVKWDLSRVYPAEGRGMQCTSADAAGFPIAPLLFNADDIYAGIQAQGDIGHAIRFILPNDRMREGVFVPPATHAGGPSNSNANSIPYGSRLRLRADFDVDAFSSNQGVRVILRTLKKYGMLLADGGNVPLTGEADTYTTHKWGEPAIDMDTHSLFGIEADDFEVVRTGDPIDLTYDCVPASSAPPVEVVFANGFD